MVCAKHGLQLRFYGGLTLFSSIRLKGGILFALKTKAGRWGKIRPGAHSTSTKWRSHFVEFCTHSLVERFHPSPGRSFV